MTCRGCDKFQGIACDEYDCQCPARRFGKIIWAEVPYFGYKSQAELVAYCHLHWDVHISRPGNAEISREEYILLDVMET